MENEKLKQLVSVYMMLNDELREGTFLENRFFDIKEGFVNSAKRDIGVVQGTHIDIVAQLIGEEKYFGDNEANIGNFRRKQNSITRAI